MPDRASSLVATLFDRDPPDAQVVVADGYGIAVRVHHGHLVVEDGIGRHRRERRYSRAERTMRRVVILGHTGYLTLEALRWCADVGVVVVHLDGDGRLLTVHGSPGTDDARLRRAQAAAVSGKVGVEIARALLGAKVDGQAAVAEEHLHAASVACVIRHLAEEVRGAEGLVRLRDVKAQASNTYFGAWAATVGCRFAERDAGRVPDHWRTFTARSSRLHRGGRSPRSAADPVNALLNYGYALAEAECRLAAIAVGLDPGLGVVHTDKKNRDSLALDLLEPLRPVVERHVLQLLAVRHFRAGDFHETRQGVCRVLAPLTHEFSERLPSYAREVAKHAERIAHLLAQSSPGKVELRTPLTRSNTTRQQVRGRRSAQRQSADDLMPRPTCRMCGTLLAEPKRQLCAACWPVARAKLAADRATVGNAALAAMRAAGEDPTNSESAAAKRSASLSRRKQEEVAWKSATNNVDWTPKRYRLEVLPTLAHVPLSALQRATALSVSACSRIRSGKLLPHRRHWKALAEVAARSAAEREA